MSAFSPELLSYIDQIPRRFPIGSLRAEVSLSSPPELSEAGLFATLTLQTGTRAPRSARVCLIPAGWIGDTSGNIRYLGAWMKALGRLLQEGADLAGAAPADLVCTDVLELAWLDTDADLADTLLMPCWLGRLRSGGAFRVGPAELAQLLCAALPVRGEAAELMGPGLGHGGIEERPSGDLLATLQLVGWEAHEGQRQIRDIKEQTVLLVSGNAREQGERVKAYLKGWAGALRVLFADLDASPLMPHDLVRPDVLRLRRAATAADFQAALLRPSRLGRR
jgi:hypothetical protein